MESLLWFIGFGVYGLIGLAYWTANWAEDYSATRSSVERAALWVVLVICLLAWPVLFLFRLFLKLFIRIGA